jgi:2-dehydro-3-deoxyphosphooctonate aldolase (KDO 8-P synthase)
MPSVKPMQEVEVGSAGTRRVRFGSGLPMAWILGPCVIEDQRTMATSAEQLRLLSEKLDIPVIFKSSFEKDNRSSEEYYSGPGIDEGLEMLAWIKQEFELPVLSDVHSVDDIHAAREVLDVIQIPAFLCQQTSLVIAAGKTGKPVNVKKGQFLSPEGMAMPVGKLERSGNRNILLTERGAQFGYNTLVADMTAIPTMQSLGYPVIFDAGHQVRRYGIPSADPRGGAREFIPPLLRAAVAAGANGLFLETHPSPEQARCDAASQFPLDRLETLMVQAEEIGEVVRRQGHA